jgi:hypothetical protein
LGTPTRIEPYYNVKRVIEFAEEYSKNCTEYLNSDKFWNRQDKELDHHYYDEWTHFRIVSKGCVDEALALDDVNVYRSLLQAFQKIDHTEYLWFKAFDERQEREYNAGTWNNQRNPYGCEDLGSGI